MMARTGWRSPWHTTPQGSSPETRFQWKPINGCIKDMLPRELEGGGTGQSRAGQGSSQGVTPRCFLIQVSPWSWSDSRRGPQPLAEGHSGFRLSSPEASGATEAEGCGGMIGIGKKPPRGSEISVWHTEGAHLAGAVTTCATDWNQDLQPGRHVATDPWQPCGFPLLPLQVATHLVA